MGLGGVENECKQRDVALAVVLFNLKPGVIAVG